MWVTKSYKYISRKYYDFIRKFIVLLTCEIFHWHLLYQPVESFKGSELVSAFIRVFIRSKRLLLPKNLLRSGKCVELFWPFTLALNGQWFSYLVQVLASVVLWCVFSVRAYDDRSKEFMFAVAIYFIVTVCFWTLIMRKVPPVWFWNLLYLRFD